MIIISKSEKQTQKIGEKLAKRLKGGEIIALSGDLGGGKTTFVKGLAKGLGIRGLVTSPSFVLLREYPLPNRLIIQSSNHLSLVHIDLYRLKSLEEIESLGLSEFLGKKDKICVIEWAEKMKGYLKGLPAKLIWVEFEYIERNLRKIKFKNKI